jgi:hypothetical protein
MLIARPGVGKSNDRRSALAEFSLSPQHARGDELRVKGADPRLVQVIVTQVR